MAATAIPGKLTGDCNLLLGLNNYNEGQLETNELFAFVDWRGICLSVKKLLLDV